MTILAAYLASAGDANTVIDDLGTFRTAMVAALQEEGTLSISLALDPGDQRRVAVVIRAGDGPTFAALRHLVVDGGNDG